MDSEATRLINEEPAKAACNTTTNAAQPTAPAKKRSGKNSNTAAAAGGGFVAGAAVGAAATAAAGTKDNVENSAAMPEAEQQNEPVAETAAPATEETAHTAEAAAAPQPAETPAAKEDVIEAEIETPEPDDVILANDEGIRFAHVNADNFGDAYAQARAQVGAGGVFQYEGKLYSTYTAEEWDSMSASDRADFQHRVYDDLPETHNEPTRQHSEPNYTASAETTGNDDVIYAEADVQTGDMIDPAPDDYGINVIGVETVETDNGPMNIAYLESQGATAAVVDIDLDGTADIIMADINGNGIVDEDEIADIREQEIEMAELEQMAADHTDDGPYLAGNDDMPDYYNEADSTMYV